MSTAQVLTGIVADLEQRINGYETDALLGTGRHGSSAFLSQARADALREARLVVKQARDEALLSE